MSTMQARFYVAEVAKRAYGGAPSGGYGEVTLSAVTRQTDDNVSWAHATPSGSLKMTVHAEALAWFDQLLGKDVYLTLNAVPVEEPAAE